MTSIALRLALLRAQRGIPQRRLAQTIGVSISTLSAWECGDRTPLLKHAIAWAKALGVRIALDLKPSKEKAASHPHDPQEVNRYPMSARQVA